MKKFFKFILGTAAVAGGVAGIWYFLQNKKEDGFEDFDDEDFDDVFQDEEEDRDYVTLDLEEEEKGEDGETEE